MVRPAGLETVSVVHLIEDFSSVQDGKYLVVCNIEVLFGCHLDIETTFIKSFGNIQCLLSTLLISLLGLAYAFCRAAAARWSARFLWTQYIPWPIFFGVPPRNRNPILLRTKSKQNRDFKLPVFVDAKQLQKFLLLMHLLKKDEL